MTLSTSLIAAWEMTESSGTRNDSHGSNHLTDHSVGSNTGLINSTVADFEKDSSQYLSLADNADVSTGDIDFTFEAWIKIESSSAIGEDRCIVGKDINTGREYTLDTEDDNPRFYIGGGSGGVAAWGSRLSTGTWYQIIAWYQSGVGVGITVNDGTPVTATSATCSDTGTELNIGSRRYPGFENYFDGLIGPVRFWKRMLTSGERTELYNSGAGRTYSYITGGSTSPISGTASLAFNTGTCTLLGSGTLTGSSTLTFSTGTCTLRGTGILTGSSSAVFTTGTCTLTGAGALTGSSAFAISTGTCTLIGAGTLTGSSSLAISTGTCTLVGAGLLSGSSAITFGSSTTLIGLASVTGTSALTFSTGTCTLLGAGELVGSSSLVFEATLTPAGGPSLIVGSSSILLDASAALLGSAQLLGSSTLSTTASATLQGNGLLLGNSTISLAGTATLAGFGLLAGSTAFILSSTALIHDDTARPYQTGRLIIDNNYERFILDTNTDRLIIDNR